LGPIRMRKSCRLHRDEFIQKTPQTPPYPCAVEAPSLPNFNLHINYGCTHSSCAVDDRQHIRSPTAYLAEQFALRPKKLSDREKRTIKHTLTFTFPAQRKNKGEEHLYTITGVGSKTRASIHANGYRPPLNHCSVGAPTPPVEACWVAES